MDEPFNCWVTRIGHWPLISQYAIKLLHCPAARVFSEHEFSAKGKSMTDKSVHLLTIWHLWKLTSLSWIYNSYEAPAEDSAEYLGNLTHLIFCCICCIPRFYFHHHRSQKNLTWCHHSTSLYLPLLTHPAIVLGLLPLPSKNGAISVVLCNGNLNVVPKHF